MVCVVGISTYLVTNAQFPNAIRNLTPVTQLYVSVDAATRDALQAIDRPLFTGVVAPSWSRAAGWKLSAPALVSLGCNAFLAVYLHTRM